MNSQLTNRRYILFSQRREGLNNFSGRYPVFKQIENLFDGDTRSGDSKLSIKHIGALLEVVSQ